MISGPAKLDPPKRGEDPAEVDRPLPDRHVLVDPPAVVRELGGVDALAEGPHERHGAAGSSSRVGDVEREAEVGRADPVEERPELLHPHAEVLELGVAGQRVHVLDDQRNPPPLAVRRRARAMVS